MSSLEELFYQIDDFCQIFEPRWQQQLLGQGDTAAAALQSHGSE